jgi:hypothetical protein
LAGRMMRMRPVRWIFGFIFVSGPLCSVYVTSQTMSRPDQTLSRLDVLTIALGVSLFFFSLVTAMFCIMTWRDIDRNDSRDGS